MTEFHPGSVPVMVASKVLGMDREVLMNSMDSGARSGVRPQDTQKERKTSIQKILHLSEKTI